MLTMKNHSCRILGIVLLLTGCMPLVAQNQDEDPGMAQNGKYHKVLYEALLLQLKADSLSRICRDKRLLTREIPDDEMKKQWTEEIIQLDKEAKLLQREADQKFSEARSLKEAEMKNLPVADTAVFLVREINDIKVYHYGTVPLPEEKVGSPAKADQFALLDRSPYDVSHPIPEGLQVHPGLVYRVQLGAFSKPKTYDAFGGISPVAFIQVNGSTLVKYYAGLFYSLNGVTAALSQIRAKGFPDAFIVAFLDGQLITTEKAREIEFEQFKL
jgi:hypothetical protein